MWLVDSIFCYDRQGFPLSQVSQSPAVLEDSLYTEPKQHRPGLVQSHPQSSHTTATCLHQHFAPANP